MAFCNSCGATLAPGTKFCNKCGATVAGAPSAQSPTPVAAAPAPSTGGSSALKIVLIVVAVIIGIGILGVATVGIVGYRIAKSAHVRQEGGNVKVETPFGNVETTNDPAQTAKELGVDVYPGAEIQKNGTATTTFGSVHSASASFTSSDSVDKVCAFYKSRISNPMVTSSDNNRCTFVSNDSKNMITINVENSGDATKIQITNVSKSDGK
jgi:flagellar basal body-associated protein FliL